MHANDEDDQEDGFISSSPVSKHRRIGHDALHDTYQLTEDDLYDALYEPDESPFAEGDEPDEDFEDDVIAINSSSDGEIEITGILPAQVPTDPVVLRAAKYKLRPAVFQRMLLFGVPAFLFNAIWVLANSFSCTDNQDLDFVEMMAGSANIEKNMNIQQLCAVGFDIRFDEVRQNFIGLEGFLCACQCFRRLKSGGRGGGGGVSWALVCASWIWMSRNATRRSKHEPLGPTDPRRRIPAVNDGNLMVSLWAAVMRWLVVMGDITWLLEQPTSSILMYHPRACALRLWLETRGLWHTTHTWMGAFGALTPKSTNLWSSTSGLVHGLHRSMTRADMQAMSERSGIATYSVNVDRRDAGLSNVTGSAHLHDTQEYPWGYGQEVTRLFRHHRLNFDYNDYEPGFMPNVTDDLWPDANFVEFAERLGVPADRLAV